jgi:hypothetical protein
MGCTIEITNCTFLIPDPHWCRRPSRPLHDQKNWIGQFGVNKVKTMFVLWTTMRSRVESHFNPRTPIFLNLRSNQERSSDNLHPRGGHTRN